MSELRLLIGDDHTLVRQGIRKILEERPSWSVIGEAANGREAVCQCAALHPDIVILDLGMPVLNGVDATIEIVTRVPATRVLILSMYADEAYVTSAIRAGAMGYLLKGSADRELIAAVEALSRRQAFFSPMIANIVLDHYLRRSQGVATVDRFDTLSVREHEIFQLIAEAKTNKEIADLLDTSPTTVETFRGRILHKLGVRNAAELILYAARRGIVR